MKVLNEQGGKAAILITRVPDTDVARLIRLATRRRKSRSAMMRELLRFALDRAELEQAGRT
ncbi:MAG: ribbon-helix-helix protein, CopG family [Streptosporangiaceae bacterium]